MPCEPQPMGGAVQKWFRWIICGGAVALAFATPANAESILGYGIQGEENFGGAIMSRGWSMIPYVPYQTPTTPYRVPSPASLMPSAPAPTFPVSQPAYSNSSNNYIYYANPGTTTPAVSFPTGPVYRLQPPAAPQQPKSTPRTYVFPGAQNTFVTAPSCPRGAVCR